VPTFDGQTVLVIGGSSGMGRGAARAIAARGGEVVITSRHAEQIPAAIDAVLADLVPADGSPAVGRVRGVVCDLTRPDVVRDAVVGCGRLDHLIVTAAPGTGVTDRAFFDGKFWGSQVACEAAAQLMAESGSMVLVSGGLADRPSVGQWSVTCAFAAVEALARALAVEYAPRRVNCIRPGLFDTALWSGMEAQERATLFALSVDGLPAGRPGTEDDFGDVAVGLIGAGYLTGQVVVVDGGRALT
jgi:NAD(P)-dependent dehydrogenase (short-subunit alcohol dehydrogenase family)